MTLTVKGFSLFEPDARSPFIQFNSLRVSLSSTSLFRFAPVVDELSLDSLQVKLIRTAANRYNFSDIIDRLAAQPKQEKGTTPRFSINNISLQGSSIDFEDRAVTAKKTYIPELQFTTRLSHHPYLAEQYTDPRFSAISSARFSFTARQTAPHSMETKLNLKLTELNLPYYLSYVPVQVRNAGQRQLSRDWPSPPYSSNTKPELMFRTDPP